MTDESRWLTVHIAIVSLDTTLMGNPLQSALTVMQIINVPSEFEKYFYASYALSDLLLEIGAALLAKIISCASLFLLFVEA